MRTKPTVIAFTLLIVFTIAGCKGEKGDTGPTGPGGNANVRTIQFTVAGSDWKTMSSSSTSFYVTKVTPLITENVVKGGTVILYYQLSSSIWSALPERFVTNTGDPYEIHYIHGLQGNVGAIQIYLSTSTGDTFDAIFKAVIIDGKLDLSKK
jgi:hypothetical protein